MSEYSESVAWLVLRIVYAWMYLYPVTGLVKNWPTTVKTTSLLFPVGTTFFAFVSVVLMIAGSLMILLGVYGQYAAVALLAFNVGGAQVHYKLAEAAKAMQPADATSADDRAQFGDLADLAAVGHITSAEKNYVLAAVAFFFALVGTGPWSLVPSTGIFGSVMGNG